MKKLYILCIALLFMFLLSACNEDISVGEFSYSIDSSLWNEQEIGIKKDNFKNTEEKDISSPQEALTLAKNEVTVSYDRTSVAYDKEAKMWKIDFWTENQLGGNQIVYIESNGITKMCVWEE